MRESGESERERERERDCGLQIGMVKKLYVLKSYVLQCTKRKEKEKSNYFSLNLIGGNKITF
jgi:hypothetical protein